MLIKALVAAALLLSAAPAMAGQSTDTSAAEAPRGGMDHVRLTAPDGRAIDVNIWRAPVERGVVVYSHGFNGAPLAYDRILTAWAEHGFTVVAPLHVDSLTHPRHAEFDNRAAFSTRLVDLAVVRGYVRARHPGMPMIAAGHSFGSLMSMIEGGAVTAAGPLGDPDIRGVIAFSSAGDLPGLVQPDTYQGLTAPLLMITGDRDLVRGYVTDWHDHRRPYDLSPAGDRMLMIFAGGDHELVGRADPDAFALIVQVTEDFLDAHALNDAAAAARLAALSAPQGVTIERR